MRKIIVPKKTVGRLRKARASSDTGIDRLRDSLLTFREQRAQVKALMAENVKEQPNLLAGMSAFDSANKGIVVDDLTSSNGTAYVQQNSPSEFWDMEEIISYLKGDKQLWASCSSRVFDQKKWEAEIANGNIPAKIAARFKKSGTTPAPFIRFGKGKEESV